MDKATKSKSDVDIKAVRALLDKITDDYLKTEKEVIQKKLTTLKEEIEKEADAKVKAESDASSKAAADAETDRQAEQAQQQQATQDFGQPTYSEEAQQPNYQQPTPTQQSQPDYQQPARSQLHHKQLQVSLQLQMVEILSQMVQELPILRAGGIH